MLSNNKIKGIVPAILAQIDQKRSIKFNVSSRISLEQYFNGIVNKCRFLTLLSGVAVAVLEGEEYMLDSSSFLLEPSYINGSMLPSNQEYKLEHGDTLTLANENFEYKVM